MVDSSVPADSGSAAAPDKQKSPLHYLELRDAIDLSLWTGQILLQAGANSPRVEETVHRLGTGLGCDWLDVIVTPGSIAVTASSHGEFRSKTRRVVRLGANMWVITAINRLSRRIGDESLDRQQVRAELEQIAAAPPRYHRWLVVIAVGLACAAFSRLFGGDRSLFAITWVAAAAAMLVRQELARRYFNDLLIVSASAFVAGVVAILELTLLDPPNASVALEASVLLLVPGVQLIGGATDLFAGHILSGISRGFTGLLISLSIALGLLLAIGLMQSIGL